MGSINSIVSEDNMVKRVHHINFLVHDLEAAIKRYQELLGVTVCARESLESRGVRLARFRVGEVWIVLVQPISEEGVPAHHLRRYGEVFFLISYEVDDVVQAANDIKSRGVRLIHEEPRQGISGWRLMDLDPADTFGTQIQLTETLDE
jgi:methylmalonyl-CoA/ethylmalonyl-CoA epimerase